MESGFSYRLVTDDTDITPGILVCRISVSDPLGREARYYLSYVGMHGKLLMTESQEERHLWASVSLPVKGHVIRICTIQDIKGTKPRAVRGGHTELPI